MTFQDMKELLLKYPEMTEKINGINKEIEHAKEEAQSVRECKSVNVDGMPRGSIISDTTAKKAENVVDRYDKRIAKLLDEINAIMDKQHMLTDLLRILDPDEYKVIEARYLKGNLYERKWDFVPGRVHISKRACFNIHNRAIMKMINAL